jgi:hypothetical protein
MPGQTGTAAHSTEAERDHPTSCVMYAVKRPGAAERSLGRKTVSEKGCGRAERETTVNQTLTPRVCSAFRVFVSGLSSVSRGRATCSMWDLRTSFRPIKEINGLMSER